LVGARVAHEGLLVAGVDELHVVRVIAAEREWKKVGFQPLKEGELRIPDQFIQDIVDPYKSRIVGANGVERPATLEECEGLERAAVWDSEHVVERISAYYKGEPSEFVESLKLERPKG
jgi:hypothetical protein